MLRSLTSGEQKAQKLTAEEIEAWLRSPVTEALYNRIRTRLPPPVAAESLETASCFKLGFMLDRDEIAEIILNAHSQFSPEPDIPQEPTTDYPETAPV